MKKLVVSALALAFISFATAEAQTAQQADANAQETTTQQKSAKDDKVAVKPSELPEGIRKTIQSDQFEGWTVRKAYLVTEEDKTQYYELQVAKGKESARVRLDKDGNNVG
jgi:Ni/Co efflux regulator RcnB